MLKNKKNTFLIALIITSVIIVAWKELYHTDKNISPRKMNGATVLYSGDSAYYIQFKIDTAIQKEIDTKKY